MRALFVLHECIFIYGANRSISGILENIDYDYDLMICKSFTKHADERELRERFGGHLKKIYSVWLPKYRCCVYDKISFFSECTHWINSIMSVLYAKKREKIIQEGNYDYIHLNSVVLYPMINTDVKFIIHVRELIEAGYWDIVNVKKALEAAAGVIYIDDVTKKYVQKIADCKTSIVINNPFDMRKIKDQEPEEGWKKYGLTKRNTVFAMLGLLNESKGSKFVISSFMKHRNEQSRLLIVGNDTQAYGRECRDLAKDDGRIIFCGELADTSSIYCISDYVIRGEEQFCIGRTVYEGLYSGTGVIMPGSDDNLESIPDGRDLRDQIYFYEPRKESDLVKVVSECSAKKRINRTFRSNIQEYMKKYYGFVDTVLKKEEVVE